jgi:TRAP-type C4-dicarboxylate transport system permease small subunit
MSKPKQLLLGVLTIWPLAWTVIFLVVVGSLILTTMSSSTTMPSNQSPAWFPLMFLLQFLTIILIFVLLFIYIKNVFRNDRIPQNKKTLWAAVLFFGSIIAMPIYWYLYIWKGLNEEQVVQ